MGQDYFRQISVKLLFKLFYRSGLSANKITVLNFLTLGLGSLILFIRGYEYAGLLVAGLMAMVDYIDGSIARARGGNSKLGQYLDTSLDWLWLMLFIGAVSYHNNVMLIGYLALIAIVFGNWIQYNGNVNVRLCFPFRVAHLMVFGILTNHVAWALVGVAIFQWYRAIKMYWGSVWNMYKE